MHTLYNAGYLIQVTSYESALVKSWAIDNVALVAQNIACFALATTISFLANVQLAAISIAGFAAVVPATILQAQFLAGESGSTNSAAVKSSNEVMVECFRCSRTVDAFNLHAAIMEEFDTSLVAERQNGHKKALYCGFFYGLSQFLQFGAQALNLWVGGRYFAKGKIADVRTMMQGTFTMIIAAMGIGQASSNASEGSAGKKAAQRVFSLLDVLPYPDSRDPSGMRVEELKGNITFKNLAFAFPVPADQPVSWVRHNYFVK